MGCTYVKEFSFGGKVTPAVAVHKHEKALHPDKPMTKMAKGGKVMEKSMSRKAMMKHEKEETPRMQREEIMQKSSVRAPRRAMPVASSEPLIAMKKGGPPQRPMPQPDPVINIRPPRDFGPPSRFMPQYPRDPGPAPMPQRPLPRLGPAPMPERPMPRPPMLERPMPRPQITPPRDSGPMPMPMPMPMPRPQVTPPMMKKGGMHKMPDGKMMKNSAMKKSGMANPNC